MAVIAKDGIDVRHLHRGNPTVLKETESTYETDTNGKPKHKKINREVRNQEKRNGWENEVLKARERRMLCNSYR